MSCDYSMWEWVVAIYAVVGVIGWAAKDVVREWRKGGDRRE